MITLITGATGFIGSSLVERLNREGVHPKVLLRASSSMRNLEGLQYQTVLGDLTDPESLRNALAGVETVFHLAGVISAHSFEEFRKYNEHGTRSLAEASAAQGVHQVVYASSLAAGGPMKTHLPRTERMPDAPSSQYGQSKRLGEQALLKFKDQFKVTIIRPPMVYGPRDRSTLLFFKQAARGVVPCVRGRSPGGKKYYSLIHAQDLCESMVLASRSKTTQSGEIFYVSGNENVSFDELLGEISSHFQKKPLYLPVPRWVVAFAATCLDWKVRNLGGRAAPLTRDKLNEIFPDYWLCSNEKARSQLGFEPQVPWKVGVQETAQWYRSKGWV